jgi:hypothetical protein
MRTGSLSPDGGRCARSSPKLAEAPEAKLLGEGRGEIVLPGAVKGASWGRSLRPAVLAWPEGTRSPTSVGGQVMAEEAGCDGELKSGWGNDEEAAGETARGRESP